MRADWWCDFFDEVVAGLILSELRVGELEFVWDRLALKKGCILFDQCCGWGRVSGPLAEAGVRVLGVDGCEALVRAARAEWSEPNMDIKVADAASYCPTEIVDAAMNLYTSFGCSSDDDYNKRVLANLVKPVRAGGRVLLDLINPLKVLQAFKPVFQRRTDCGALITRESVLLDNNTILAQKWTFLLSGGEQFEREGITKLYTAEQIEEMLCNLGCNPLQNIGGFDGSDYGRESERMIWIAEV